MKKLLFTILFALVPLVASASPVSVDRLNNDHIEPLIKTDYIKAPHFTATSTTATSTFAGYLQVNGSTFLVDPVLNRVGVGTSSPYAKLSVLGDVPSSGNAVDFIALYGGAGSPFFQTNGGAGIIRTGNGGGAAGLELFNDMVGGNGGVLNLLTGDGGGAVCSFLCADSYIGGDGGNLILSSGNGGTVSGASITNIGGDGGHIILLPGSGGAGATANGAQGNVGIGTTSPYAKLSVVGEVVGAYFTATTSTASTFPYASTTALSATSLCLSTDCRTSWPVGGGADYPFPLTGNATSTLTQFNGGLTSYASTTIGGGTQITGLTISGGATTTGNAYFAGNVGVGTMVPSAKLHVKISASGLSAHDTSADDLILEGNGNTGFSIISAAPNTQKIIMGTQNDGTGVEWSWNDNTDLMTLGTTNSLAQLSLLSGNGVETMRLNASNYVGIGTTSPYAKLSVVGEVVAPYYTATSTTATSTFATGLRLRARVNSNNFAEMYAAQDINNGAQDALYIVPSANSHRIYFGRAGKTAYSLNFASVTNFESVPTRLIQTGAADSAYCPYSTCAVLGSGTSGASTVLTGSLGMEITNEQDTWNSSNPGLFFKSYNYDDATYRSSRPYAYSFDTASSSAKMRQIQHTIWQTGGTRIMTMTPLGQLGIGTSTPVASLQVATTTANATTSVIFGKANQNKGTCRTEYDTSGSPVYIYIAAGATSYTMQNGGTKPSGCEN